MTKQMKGVHSAPGEVAELLDMEEQELAVRILPSALAKLTEAEDIATLNALASKVGTPLPVLMKEYGHHVVAKYLYEGMPQNCFLEQI